MTDKTSDVKDNLQRLRRIDVCAVSDAMDKLGLRGAVMGLPQRSGDGRIAGVAITVKLGLFDPTSVPSGPVRHLGCTAIELADDGHVIVVEQKTGVHAGCWGGLLSLGARMRGIAGVIADGPVRDIDEAIGYGVPVFSRSLTQVTARGRVQELGTNVPVNIDGILVMPGDYVTADRSGVVVIPAARIGDLLDAAEGILAKEAAMARALMAGTPIGQVMGGNYEHMLTS